MPRTSRTFRIFVSSTFTDLKDIAGSGLPLPEKSL
jgi:hypothetical protein